jgi:hypothetical protein
METVVALTIMAVVFAAIMPLFKQIRDNWDSKEASAETLQNGRILIDHINRNLSKALRITAVSGPNTTSGYIEFKDNNSVTFRYDVSSSYVEYGQTGNLSNLAGPVSQLQFTCYDANDFNTPTTDVNSMRLVKVQTTLTNSLMSSQDKTLTASVYLRTNGNDTGNGGTHGIVYTEQSQSVPRYRLWEGSAWSVQQLASDVGAYPKWVVSARCPTRPETTAGTLDASEDLNVQFFNGFSWTAATELANNLAISTDRPFYLAYEQLSGDLLIVYRRGNNGLLYYRTYNGTSISAESTTTLLGGGNPRWMRLVPKRGSNEILLVVLDSKWSITAAVWNGNSWGNKILLENDAPYAMCEVMWAAYEGQSGQALVVWTDWKSLTFQYRKWNGSAWLGEGNGPDFGRDPVWVKLAADPCSNQMIFAASDDQSDLRLVVWNGSSWGTPLVVETSLPGVDRRDFDVEYESSGGRALAVWGRISQSYCYYRVWNGAAWSGESTGPGLGGVVSFVQLKADPLTNHIFVDILNKNDGIQSMLWNGSTIGSPATIIANGGGDNTIESFMVVPLFRDEDVHP